MAKQRKSMKVIKEELKFANLLREDTDILNEQDFSSDHAYSAFILLEALTIKKMRAGLTWMNQKAAKDKFNFCLVGGGAIQYYISQARPQSPDIDFVVNDIKKVIAECQADGIPYSELNPALGITGITIPSMDMDVLDANRDPVFNTIFTKERYSKITAFGQGCNIIIPDLLFLNKYITARDKDITDMFFMLRTPNLLSKNKVMMLAKELERKHKLDASEMQSLQDYFLLPQDLPVSDPGVEAT